MAHIVTYNGHAILSVACLLELVDRRMHAQFNKTILLGKLIFGKIFLSDHAEEYKTGNTYYEA